MQARIFTVFASSPLDKNCQRRTASYVTRPLDKKIIAIGFIPLTDCASIVMASELGIDQKCGVKIIPSKEASWASIRDKLLSGENGMTLMMHGMAYDTQTSIGGLQHRLPLCHPDSEGRAAVVDSPVCF